MKNFALTASWILAVATAVPASAIEVVNNGTGTLAMTATSTQLSGPPGRLLLPSAHLSELPEPEVFAMMLLGLVLIGYRTSRSSDEKFE